MEDLEDKIGQILSDPDAMSNIFSMVKGLGLTPPGEVEDAPSTDPDAAFDLSALGNIPLPLVEALVSGGRDDSKHAALFGALRPFLKPERQEKLDRAMKVARLSKVATLALKTLDDK